MSRNVVLALTGAILVMLPPSRASAGPADASCVYLALGCFAPTVRLLIPLLSTDLPANNPGLLLAPVEVAPPPLPEARRHRRRLHRRASR